MSTISVSLALQTDALKFTVAAPCSGREAKAAGQRYLLAETGLKAIFSSYQPTQKSVEQTLGDDEFVLRGSILNYTVKLGALIDCQVRNSKVQKHLLRKDVLAVMAKASGRFCRRAITASDVKEADGCHSAVSKSPTLTAAVTTFLAGVGSELSAEDLAKGLDAAYTERNGEVGSRSCQVRLTEKTCMF